MGFLSFHCRAKCIDCTNNFLFGHGGLWANCQGASHGLDSLRVFVSHIVRAFSLLQMHLLLGYWRADTKKCYFGGALHYTQFASSAVDLIVAQGTLIHYYLVTCKNKKTREHYSIAIAFLFLFPSRLGVTAAIMDVATSGQRWRSHASAHLPLSWLMNRDHRAALTDTLPLSSGAQPKAITPSHPVPHTGSGSRELLAHVS